LARARADGMRNPCPRSGRIIGLKPKRQPELPNAAAFQFSFRSCTGWLRTWSGRRRILRCMGSGPLGTSPAGKRLRCIQSFATYP
jgi:hypothetical protein